MERPLFCGMSAVLVSLVLGSCAEDAPTTPEDPRLAPESVPVAGTGVYGEVCAACHGVKGEGKEELFSPSIAGLPAWYGEEQLRKFRSGQRGFHPEDLPGQQMRAISLTLTDEQISEAAASVAVMPMIPTTAPPAGADLEGGRFHFANACMECHRYNGMGEIVFHSAPLVSLNASYLKRQLRQYRAGWRGAGAGDLYGQKMADITSQLSDAEIDRLVDYIGALAHGDDPRGAREK
jgi:cytochrome c553